MAQMTQAPSTTRYDAIVIGGGVNGLTCATTLAKNGIRTVLIERRPSVGGCAADHELAPGFTVPTLAHDTGPVRRDVVEDLQLHLHGLAFSDTPIQVSALSRDGRALVIWEDARRTAQELAAWSVKDANAWPAFSSSLQRIGALAGALFMTTPPSVDAPSPRDVFALMHTLGAFRALPKADQWRLLRWGPMAAADLVGEAVETDLLQATLAADGVLGAMLGPWSAGSGLQLLLNAANRALASPSGRVVSGGPVALARALERAAIRYGVDIRTGCGVQRIDVEDDRAAGVTLENGERLEAGAIVSGVDPKRTFLSLCDADHLPPEFLWRMKHYRIRGTLAKVNLALSELPRFAGAGPRLSRARVRPREVRTLVDRPLDRVHDSVDG
jgi:phytoene dehydrogenase-like protein